MSDRKIVGIGEAKTGMQVLQEQANPRPQPQPRESQSELPIDKCLKIRIILEATDYYTTLDGFGQNEKPPFQYLLPLAYSALPQPVGGIQRHEGLQIFATGLKFEVVDLPEWWARRDAGVI